MGRFIDLTGQKFGIWTVLERAENSPSGRVQWLCKCECGTIRSVSRNELRSGESQSCGCLNKEILRTRAIDLTGQKIGRWTVLKRAKNTPRDGTAWLCRCECGTERIVSGLNLRHGKTYSCGCFNLEQISKRNSEYFETLNNLVGQKFGKLLVIERTNKRDNGQVVYKCQCDCGNITEARGSKLTDGSKQSCGCLNSKGEELISKILRENNIPFETQKTFDDCRNPKTNFLLRFDFCIDNKYLIEYNGQQHFKEKSFGHENLEERQYKDNFKNNYCKEHDIPLIRIPYTKYDTLCLEDLLLETSEFVI